MKALPTLQKVPPEAAARVRVGTAGWSYPDWAGIVYPKPAPAGFDHLEWMSRFVDVVEINSTFYRPCRSRDAQSWVKRVSGNSRFRFAAKLYRRFTHERAEATGDGADSRAAEAAYKRGIEPLAASGLLAAILVQFPYSFGNTKKNREHLSGILTRFGDYSLAVELRHRSWISADIVAFLAARGVALAGIDQPQIGQAVPPSLPLTGSFFYARLHGRNAKDWFRKDAGRDARYDYLYQAAELTPWVNRIVEAATAGATGLVVANNHFRGQALVNAIEVKSALAGGKAPAPETLIETYPGLADAATPTPTPGKTQTRRLF